jgi:hypothetical protein
MAQTAHSTIPESLDLFGAPPCARRQPLRYRRQPLELKVAGALCRQIHRQPARRDKQRIAHLICLNLVSMLKHRAKP